MPDRSRAPARIAAILALIAAMIALLMIISSAREESPVNGAGAETTEQPAEREKRPRRAVYVVKDGDTLLGIAAKTGVRIERLQELNPEIDPQVLRSGQRIKLR